jgi:hypothetical protein
MPTKTAQRATQQQPEAPAVHVPRKTARTVTVACKIPNGLTLQHFRPMKTYEQVQGGGSREVVINVRLPAEVVVEGPAYPNGPTPKGFHKKPTIIGGYAFTKGVDADFWNTWLEQNKDTDMVRNKMILAYDEVDSLRDEAKDHAKLRSGLEPMSPFEDPRRIRSLANGNVRPIETADERKDQIREIGELAGYEDTE